MARSTTTNAIIIIMTRNPLLAIFTTFLFLITPATAQFDFLTFSQSPASSNTTQQTILIAGICAGATAGAAILFCVLAHFGPRMLCGRKMLDQLKGEDRQPWFAARGINDEKPLNSEYLEQARMQEKMNGAIKVSKEGKLVKSKSQKQRQREEEERRWKKEGEMV